MTQTIARRALEIDRAGGYGASNNEFRFLGAGVSRQVYLHIPTGNAYKVPTAYSNNSHVNFHEAAVSAWFRQNYKFPGVIWPDFVVHDVNGEWVSEVTFFENDHSVGGPVAARFAKFLNDMGVADACWDVNIFSCKGFMVPIDLGYHGLCGVSPWDPNYWAERWEKSRKWEEEIEVNRNPPTLRPEFVQARQDKRNGWRNLPDLPPCDCAMCVPF